MLKNYSGNPQLASKTVEEILFICFDWNGATLRILCFEFVVVFVWWSRRCYSRHLDIRNLNIQTPFRPPPPRSHRFRYLGWEKRSTSIIGPCGRTPIRGRPHFCWRLAWALWVSYDDLHWKELKQSGASKQLGTQFCSSSRRFQPKKRQHSEVFCKRWFMLASSQREYP